MIWTAVYVDNSGAVFSCPITKIGNKFILATQNGPAPITYYIHGSDLAGGFASFRSYRIDDMPNLRGCDAIALMDKMNQTLPVPQKPADPPQQAEPEDTPLHVEPRQPGESSFAKLKEAGARAEALYRSRSQFARRQVQENLNRPDPQTIAQSQQARQQRNEIASLKKRG